VEHLGFLAHELRNALNSVNVSFMLIKRGTVGMNGSTGDVLERGLKRMEGLIDRSLTEVRLSADPKVLLQKLNLLIILDQILITAAEEAKVREQEITVDVDSSIEILVDQQLFYSGLNNLIQNALKYTHVGGKIQIRAKKAGRNVRIEVEDECGGLAAAGANLFKPFEQHNDNRIGLGLGLTIAKKAMELNQGTITVEDLPERGCIFTIIIPYIA
ncbi:MAG: HAMP domain-containing histidine kinase, partial [Bdellovibrionales bacterium]|nr:HAMP domain-containing histidine kinase [Oligoflexia bacterium]